MICIVQMIVNELKKKHCSSPLCQQNYAYREFGQASLDKACRLTISWLSTNVTRLFLTVMSTNGCIVYLSAADCQHTSQHCSLLLCQHSTVDLGNNQVSIKFVLNIISSWLSTNFQALFFSFCQQSIVQTVNQASITVLLFLYQQLCVNKFHSTVLHHIVNKAPSTIGASKHQYCLYCVMISSRLSTNFRALLFIAL